VRFGTPVTSASVDIINLQGALVMSEKVENSDAITLNVSSLKQGMYLVKIKTSANDYDTLRFIKN
jgi:LEA14-like dessication related protein